VPGSSREGRLANEVLRPHVDLGVSCAGNLRADEALLRAGSGAVRVAVLSDLALSVGVEVPTSVEYVARARELGLPVVRRSSGGTALLHAPGDLAWALVLPRSDPRVGRDFARGYGRLGIGAVRFLQERGVPSSWAPSPGLSSSYCLLGSRGSVLTVAGRILGGAAQHLTQEALLHHGIIPHTLDRRLLASVFHLSTGEGLGRLTCLEDLGLRESPAGLASRLAHALSPVSGEV